jgi:inosose dehydratase
VNALRVANAPLSYGAFEMTVGVFPNVPGPDELLAEMASAGYAGTELGPPRYMGEGDELRARLERHGLALTGGWCPLRFSEPEHWDEDLVELRRTLDLFEAAGTGRDARPVFGDGGSEARRANPGRGADDRSLGLDDAGWRRFADGLARAQEVVHERGLEPTFHPHTSTYVEAPREIERLLELSDVGLLVDTGHLLVGGSDPVRALRDWGARVNYVHVKDVRMDVLRGVIADRADALEAWRRGIFCELGSGDVDLDAFFSALRDTGYEGWICVEQDRIPREDEPLSESAEAQVRNREWLREHLGV